MAVTLDRLIYNLALGYIGEYAVTDAATTTKQYILCLRFYAQARDEVLVSHLWNEAMVRAEIVQDAANPIFGYDRRYSIPTGALRIVSVDDDIGSDVSRKSSGIDAWEVEGEYILSDAGLTPPTWSLKNIKEDVLNPVT